MGAAEKSVFSREGRPASMYSSSPLLVGLPRLLHVADELPGEGEQLGPSEGAVPELAAPRVVTLARGRDVLEGAPDLLRQLGIGGDAPAQVVLLRALARHGLFVAQRLEPAAQGLEAVFEAEDRGRGPPLVFGALRRIFAQGLQAALVVRERVGDQHVALGLDLRDRLQPRRRAGVPGHEHEVAFPGARPAPAQPRRRARRLPVLVRAEERGVEVEARIVEVVGVAAEVGGLAPRARTPGARPCTSCRCRARIRCPGTA